MRNITTMKEIAKRAQVSLGTVSNVVNRTRPVREHLRERVLEAIRSLEYQPSQLARGLRRNSTNMLGMLIPDITNPFFPGVVRGAEDVAFKGSYRVGSAIQIMTPPKSRPISTNCAPIVPRVC